MAFDSFLLSHGLIDFDTILIKCLELLRTHPEILDVVREQYPFIFIDEYQDINGVQHALIKLAVGSSGAVTAIGDPRQSIYGFRGSDPGFFESFINDFPCAQVLALTENFRTSPSIVRAFSQVIAPLRSAIALPPLSAAVQSEGRLTVCCAPTGAAEAEYIVEEIEQLVGGTSMLSHDSGRVTHDKGSGLGFSDIAVLYRTNSLRRPLEEAMKRSGLPFSVTGEKPFHSHPSARAALDLLRFSSGETLAAEKLCTLFDLTPKQSDFLVAAAADRPGGIDMNGLNLALSNEETAPASMRRSFAPLLRTAAAAAGLCAAADLPQALSICFTLPLWKKTSPESEDVRERLCRIARISGSYGEFMDMVLLQREEDGAWSRSEAVSLMTLHASKGLEWPAVFIIGCENGTIPLERKNGFIDLDEERRLFYVGMSRAKELLCLSHAKRRSTHGEQRSCAPSPFLSDIEERLRESDDMVPKRRKADAEQMSLF